MTGGGNADSKWGEKKMAREDSVRTVDCLRGRLLAERVASRNAKEEAEQLEYKLMELEKLLKQEAKSRNRAEKRLRFLMKKLESMNISYVSDESEYSGGLLDKSDISSVSSSTTSSSNTKENSTQNQQMKTEIEESEENAKSQKGSENLQQINGSENCLLNSDEDLRSQEGSENFQQNIAKNASNEDSLSSASYSHSEKSSDLGSNQDYNDAKVDEQSDICNHSVKTSAEEELNQADPDRRIDNSMALVLVDPQHEEIQTVDPEVLDATVKQVLDSLRHAKEQIQSSMERRRTNMIKVG